MATTSILGVGLAALLLAGPALAQVQFPLKPGKIPQFAQPLPQLGATGIPFTLGTQVVDPGNLSQQNVDITLCEFQTTILPAGTILAAGKAVTPPLTWVWGYQDAVAGVCNPLPGHSYLGPVVLAKRGIPTQMTFTNRLPDATASMVQAYKKSTDQTVMWGDPLSLISATAGALPITRIDGTAIWGGPVANPTPPPAFLSPLPETNECYFAARDFHLGLIPAMPLNCLDNYGFVGALPAYIAPIPAAVHIHGGEVPAGLDGGPDSWWTPNGIYGHGFYSRGGVADAAAGKAVYVYPNGQEAAPIWFHDHILGATRLNVYAGIAGGYMITDDQFSSPDTLPAGLLPLGLDRNANSTLDLVAGAEEVLIPLIIQDRMFDDAGQLYFPAVGINPEHPYWIPEFVGDTIAVNGAVWPVLTVQPQRYRFLVLNGSNARAYELGFANTTPQRKLKKGQPPPPPLVTPGIYVIGNDQGYLDAPQFIPAGAAVANKLVIMPGERYEIIVDFAGAGGQTLELTNTAATPYPFGAPVNPAYDGKVMQVVVAPAPAVPVADTSYNPASGIGLRYKLDTAAIPPVVVPDPIVRLADPATGTIAPGVTVSKVRRLTLNEVLTLAGPLEILVNNTLYDGNEPRPYNDFTPVTSLWNTSYYSELPHEGETELWEIVNLTVDAHPMHPHLVGFQVLNREAMTLDPLGVPLYNAVYDAAFPGRAATPPLPAIPAGVYMPGFGPPLDYNCGLGAPARGVIDPATCVYGGNPDTLGFLTGIVTPPSPQEIGWKDTFMVLPGMVNRALVRFGKTTAPIAAPVGYDFNPGEGHGYVWHCHIIDHEDNEMMRPYQVVSDPVAPRTYVQGLNY